ncbi:arginine--tRNA ligase, partial [Candidatus Woesearchaeota archaeon]
IAGPYLNFFVNYNKFIPHLLKEINKTVSYGRGITKNETIMLEYIGENPLKDLHIGHLRQAAIGGSLHKILDYAGFDVIPVNYYNDSGLHIAKCLWAYDKFYRGKERKIKEKGPWLGEIYVRGNQEFSVDKNVQEEVKKIHQALEKSNNKWTRLKDKLYVWSVKYFDEFHKDVDAKFKKIYRDSDFTSEGKKIVKKLEKTKYLTYEDNVPLLDLTEFGLQKTILLRSDGAALYLTKDLAMAFQRFKDFKLDRLIYITGSEQNLNFQQLFKTLEILKLKQASKLFHLGVELVYDRDGKKYSSREGTAVSYYSVLNNALNVALQRIEERNNDLILPERKKLAKKLAIGALLYYLNKVSPKKKINFDIEQAVSFEGQTGPYLQYSYVRALRIIEKAKIRASPKSVTKLDSKLELDLIKKLYFFPHVVQKAAESYQPHLLAEYAFELASLFSSFYEKCSVTKVDKTLGSARLYLVKAYLRVIEKCLKLLGIPVVNKM